MATESNGMNQQLNELPGYPFHRLDALLADLEPGAEPVLLSIGCVARPRSMCRKCLWAASEEADS